MLFIICFKNWSTITPDSPRAILESFRYIWDTLYYENIMRKKYEVMFIQNSINTDYFPEPKVVLTKELVYI